MWISPKPMVDGFVKIFDEFRNGCDEKSDTISPHLGCNDIEKLDKQDPLMAWSFFD